MGLLVATRGSSWSIGRRICFIWNVEVSIYRTSLMCVVGVRACLVLFDRVGIEREKAYTYARMVS